MIDDYNEVDSKLGHYWDNSWAVAGFEHERAMQLIKDIELNCGKIPVRRLYGKQIIQTHFTDGTVLRWIPPFGNFRGYRFGKLWCNKSISIDELHNIILPMYFGEIEDIIWVDNFTPILLSGNDSGITVNQRIMR